MNEPVEKVEPLLRVVDIETTGLDPEHDGVIELGCCNVEKCAGSGWQVTVGGAWLVNPGVPISPTASAVHQLVDSDLVDAEEWETAAIRGLKSCRATAFVAHNARFEMGFIGAEFTGDRPWICTYKAALRLWPDAPGHSNQVLRHWRKPAGLDRATADVAHRAYPDAYVTAHLLRDMLNEGVTVEQLVAWSSKPALQTICRLGKYRGKPWRDVDSGFIRWVLTKGFDEDVMFTARHELDRRAKENVG